MDNKESTARNENLVSRTRRRTAQTLPLAGMVAAYSASGASEWVKPLVQLVVLPVHAACTQPCPELELELSEFDSAPPGGGNAYFLVTLSTPGCALVSVDASVDNGELIGSVSAVVGDGASLQFVWRGPGAPGQAVPLDPTNLRIDWRCSEMEAGTTEYDLSALASGQSG